MIENKTLRQKIGQMIMMGFPTKEVTPEFRQFLKDYQIGNIILFAHNVESSTQLKEMCEDLQKTITQNTGYPAFISVDQEGGMVSRMPADAVSIPAAMAISATANPKNAYLAGKITGEELCGLGMNMDLAPDMDINCNANNPVIGVRSFGDTKETVTEYGIQFMKGLQDGGVLSVVKHFPGHGNTAVDSHLGLPKVEKTLDELMENEFIPFQTAIENGVCGVMSSHILFPNIEKGNVPCTMSHTFLTDIVKKKLGFNGLVFTDCLEMNAIQTYYGTAKGALAAVLAGAHILCLSHTEERVKETVEYLEDAVRSGELPEQVIDEAVEKIYFYKGKISSKNQNFCCVGSKEHRAEIERISQESLTLVHEGSAELPIQKGKILFVGCYANRSTLASSSVNKDFNFAEYMADQFEAESLITPLEPTKEEILEITKKAKNYDLIVLGTYNGKRFAGQVQLANSLCKECKQVMAISLFNPYDLGMIDDKATKIAAYEYTVLSFQSLTKLLRGEIKPQGKLSVTI